MTNDVKVYIAADELYPYFYHSPNDLYDAKRVSVSKETLVRWNQIEAAWREVQAEKRALLDE